MHGLVRFHFEGGSSALDSDVRPARDSDRFWFVLAERAVETDVDVSWRVGTRVVVPGRQVNIAGSFVDLVLLRLRSFVLLLSLRGLSLASALDLLA